MRTRPIKRTTLLLCAVFVLAVFFSIGFQFVHAGHHCEDGRCPVCVAYAGAQFTMRVIGLLAIARALQLLKRLASPVPAQPRCPVLLFPSPVSLSIRLND